MIILEVLLGIKYKQGDVTKTFLHADVGKGENIYEEIPRGFKQKLKTISNKVLNLKRLYIV